MDSSKEQKNQQNPHGEEKQFSIQPIKDTVDTVKDKFSSHQANPGPAIPKDFSAQEEGTKEERRAKAAEWNKE